MRGKYRRLSVELVITIIASFVIAATVFYIAQFATSYYIADFLDNGNYSRHKEAVSVRKLQEIIHSKNIHMSEFSTLEKELRKEHIWYWAISSEQGEQDAFHDETARTYILANYPNNSYTIEFLDGVAKLYIISDYESMLYTNVQNAILIVCLLVFVIVFLKIISKKIQYLNRISKEIKEMEAGDLNNPVSIQGRDELTSLAENLNIMRLALKDQIEMEKEARKANRDLVTALSHDLRTPLTSQLGYLEILKNRKFETYTQYSEYLDKCIANCEQLHRMSDRMFEYFLVSNKTSSDVQIELSTVDGRELLCQMISEKCLLLEEQGYRFHLLFPEVPFQLSLNIDYMFRIIENVFSNIEKYAEKADAICFSLFEEDGECVLIQKNRIRERHSSIESTKIGLRSVEQMTLRQNGSFQSLINNGEFNLVLRFPLISE